MEIVVIVVANLLLAILLPFNTDKKGECNPDQKQEQPQHCKGEKQ